MKAKRWLAGFLIQLLVLLIGAGALVARVDPFFHYHAPDTGRWFYPLDNQRSMNDGILRHFDYDAMITGSSMTVNFRTSELDALFGTHAVKVPASGGSLYEIDGLVKTAIEAQPKLRMVVRSVDRNLLIYGSDVLRNDLGEYPFYLYDRNPFNDYKYLLNADVVFGRTAAMLLQARQPGFTPGVTSFDEYSNTMETYRGAFGLPELDSMLQYPVGTVGEPQHLSERLRRAVVDNVGRNLVATAKANPQIEFYYFFPPYSLAYWHDKLASGMIYEQLEAEQLAIEMMLECDNIHLYDFGDRMDLLSDVNNYRDLLHYGDWINSLILREMCRETYRLTKANAADRMTRQLEAYSTADYGSLLTQERYHCDYYAAALLNEELTGVAPRAIAETELAAGELRRAALSPDPDTGAPTLNCTGTLSRDPEQDLGAYLYGADYIGLKLDLPDAGMYSYLCFLGRNTALSGRPAVFVYDADGACVASCEAELTELVGGWQRFAVDLRGVTGPATVIFHGGDTDYNGSPASSFAFKDFILY